MEKVFISSVQKEFAEERKALAQYLRQDPLLSGFFEPFLFEEVAANTYAPGDVYLEEVKRSKLYIGLLGAAYGYEDAEGVSPTEREYDQAKNEHIPRWIYIKGGNELARQEKEQRFIAKVGADVSRKRFANLEELKAEVYSSCVLYLRQTGKIESRDFDESLCHDASLENIDTKKVSVFVATARLKRNFPLKETASVEQVLRHLNLYRNGKVVNSAILAFGVNPQKFFTTATVKCAHFHGFVVEKPIPDYKEFGGTVFEMAEDAVDFVLAKISLSTGTRDVGNQVATAYEVPRAAISEAIINAVAHRNYHSKGSVQVSVFKDRVEVSNPGALPPELELNDLSVPHASYPHNALLASCMFLTGDIERFGTGTLDIFKLTKAQGLAIPVFSADEGFKVVLWRPSANAAHVTEHDTEHVTEHDTEHVAPRYLSIEELGHRVVWILDYEQGRNELMERLDLKHRPNFMEKYLKPALDEGLIEMTLPDKPTSTKQKYRLTNKGLMLQETLKRD